MSILQKIADIEAEVIMGELARNVRREGKEKRRLLERLEKAVLFTCDFGFI